jgi:hypothetical protein
LFARLYELKLFSFFRFIPRFIAIGVLGNKKLHFN